MEEVKGAVIIPSYNKAEYLEDCIKSALMQEAPFPIYVILSDDGSSDASPSICDEYSRYYPERIVNISSMENMGVAPNVFKCVKYALSIGVTHMLMMGCDDFLCHKDYFCKQVEFLLRHPDCTLSYANGHYIGTNHTLSMELAINKTPNYTFKYTKINTRKVLVQGDMLLTGSTVYATRFLNGFFEEFATDDAAKDFLAEDLPLVLYYSRFGKFAKCEVDALAIRDLPESASRSRDLKKIDTFSKSCLQIRQRFIHLYENDNWYLLRQAEDLYQTKMLRRYAKTQPNTYIAMLKKACRVSPHLLFSKGTFRSVLVYLRNKKKV